MDNKTAIITGASSGIGKELAFQLADKNWNVFLIARRKNLLKSITDEINNSNAGHADWYACDVTNKKEVEAATKKAMSSFGDISLVIANAGIREQVSIKEFDLNKIKRIYDVNVFGVLNTIKASLPYLLERGEGQIIAVSSISSFCSLPKGHPYCASKAALNKHMRGLYYELQPFKITASTIFLGFVRTPMIEGHSFNVPLVIEAAKAARKIIKSIGSKKRISFINCWHFLFFIRLMNLLPEFLHYFLFKKTNLA